MTSKLRLSQMGEFGWLKKLIPRLYWPSSLNPQLWIGPGDDAGAVRIMPGRVLLAWHLGPDFRYDLDPAKSTEIEVQFIAESPSTTRVELVHRGFEVHGERAEELRAPVDSENGWSGLLRMYAAEVAESS